MTIFDTIVDHSLQEVHCHTIHIILELFLGNKGFISPFSSFFLSLFPFLCLLFWWKKKHFEKLILCHMAWINCVCSYVPTKNLQMQNAADYNLSQSLNCLVLPLPPSSRHDDNCSIGTIGGGRMPDAIAPHACSFNSSADYELALILKEIRFITDQVSSWVL